MSSEHLASAKDHLKGDLGGSWNMLDGASGQYTDLGIARRFGGAAAAYSLRDVGAMNGPVVRVRRSSDSTEAIDDEENFSANQVASGALEDWVNGKLENTLPADVATAAAAFSLRKVRASYAGNAVRIRRSSDNIEVNVGFDSEDKVSASSPISNVVESSSSSDVSSTTLGEFVNGTDAFVHTWYDQTEDTTVTGNEYTSSFGSGDFDSFGDNALQDSARTNPVQGIGGFDGFALHLKVDSSGSSFQVGSKSSMSYSAGDGLRFKLGLYMPSTNTDLRKIKVFTDGSNGSGRTMGGEYLRPALDQWVDYEFTDVAESNIIGFRFLQDDGTKGQCAVGDEVYVRLIVIDAITKGGDNAIEETVVNQPKIATSGSVLDHINFDGNTFLNIGTNLMDATDGTTSMVMSNIDIDVETFYLSSRDGNDGFNFFNDTGSGEKGKFKYAFVGSGASLTSNAFVSDNSNDKFLVTFTKDSNDREFFGNGAVLADDGASNTYTSAGGTNTSIGRQGSSSTASTSKLMRVYEIVSYNTDQTDNRFKIESNINNYWGLYDVNGDGFVETWYDQSGNGRDVTQNSASLQPKIVSSGSLVTLNSKPAISFAGTGVRLSVTRFLTSQGNTYFAAYDVTNSLYPTQAGIIFRQGKNYRLAMSILNASDGHKIRTQARDGGEDQARADTSSSFDGQTILHTSIVSATRDANGLKTFVNSANEATADTTDVQDVDFSTVSDGSNPSDNAFYIGSINTGIYDFLGNLGEVILFNTDLTADTTDLENDINNHYNIY